MTPSAAAQRCLICVIELSFPLRYACAAMHTYLARTPLFRTVPARELQAVGAAAELRRFRKGEALFTEGQPAAFVWIVKRGWVYLVKRTPHGGLATIFAMTPDEAICGVSAFDHSTYSAGAVAATDTQAIQIPAAVFAGLLERHPKFSRQVLLTCCHRMRHMAEAISIAQAPVEQRLAHVLLRLRTTFGNTLPVTHKELARMAGTRLETSIRTISRMKRRGWIASSRGRITLLAPQGLRTLLRAAHRSEALKA